MITVEIKECKTMNTLIKASENLMLKKTKEDKMKTRGHSKYT